MKSFKGKNGPFLVAEIGGNHEGNFQYAKKLTELACSSGVDAVKHQIYEADTLVNINEDPDRYAHFKKFQLTPDQYISLARLCKRSGVLFTSSVWSLESINWIDEYMDFYKIGSGDLTAYPLLKGITGTGKPIVLSTGLSNLSEVKNTVDFIRHQDSKYISNKYLAILQCTSMYPIPDDEVNLFVMSNFKKVFGTTIGYSDHTIGSKAVEIAVAMGAEIIEIHFTDDRTGKKFRDHRISFTKDETKNLIQNVKKIRTLQGINKMEPLQSEIESGHLTSFRRAVYPCCDIKKGSRVTENEITVLRPNNGIPANEYYKILGKRLNRDVIKHEILRWEYFD